MNDEWAAEQQPSVEETEIAFKEFITVRREKLRYKNGYKHTYYSMDLAPYSVSVIATTNDNKFLFNEEYRHPSSRFVLSCPGGFLDDNEDPLSGAKRELLEETGYDAERFSFIGSAYPQPGLCSQKVLFVHAENVKKLTDPNLEPSEVIRSRLMGAKQLRNYIKTGYEVDGILCSGLFFYSLLKNGL